MDSVKDTLHVAWVPPFRHLRINACLPTPRSFSQATTSFIAFDCQGIHHLRLFTWFKNPARDSKSYGFFQNDKLCLLNIHSYLLHDAVFLNSLHWFLVYFFILRLRWYNIPDNESLYTFIVLSQPAGDNLPVASFALHLIVKEHSFIP